MTGRHEHFGQFHYRFETVHFDKLPKVFLDLLVRRPVIVEIGQERRSWRVEGHPSSIAFSPSGKHLAVARHTTSVWDVETGEELAVIFRSVSSSGDRIRYSPDGKSLAVGGHQGLQFWDVSPLLPADEASK